jgi:hypothetical protein
MGAGPVLNGSQSILSQIAISGRNFDVRDGRSDRLRLPHERDFGLPSLTTTTLQGADIGAGATSSTMYILQGL